MMRKMVDFLVVDCYNGIKSRRRDVPNGEIPKANLLFYLREVFFL